MPAKPAKLTKKDQVEVRTPNVLGAISRVDAAKYHAMRKVLLKVLPKKAPGLTQRQMMGAVQSAADAQTFPGTTYQWWAKCVQLDLEVKKEVVRDATKPLTWRRA
jgi:hypothetical protein